MKPRRRNYASRNVAPTVNAMHAPAYRGPEAAKAATMLPVVTAIADVGEATR